MVRDYDLPCQVTNYQVVGKLSIYDISLSYINNSNKTVNNLLAKFSASPTLVRTKQRTYFSCGLVLKSHHAGSTAPERATAPTVSPLTSGTRKSAMCGIALVLSGGRLVVAPSAAAATASATRSPNEVLSLASVATSQSRTKPLPVALSQTLNL